MNPEDFLSPLINVSQYTLNQLKPRPYIDNIRRVVIQKGTRKFKYSSEVGEDGELRTCNLFSKKQKRIFTDDAFQLETHVKRQIKARGIELERKTTLLKVVLPVISADDREYWNNVPVVDK